MELTSGSLTALLCAIALGLWAGTVWAWPRLAGRSVRNVLSRVGLLAAGQLGVVLALLVAVNAHFVFYSGWDDLLGANGGAAAIKHRLGQGGPQPPSLAVVGHEPTANPAKDGQTDHIQILGQGTGLTSEAYVVLPAQYFQPQFAARRFPVVVMLTGYPGNPRGLVRAMHFPALVRIGEASGKVQPAIYVLMTPTLVSQRDTECTDVPGGPQVESFFAADLPQAISSGYRTATSRNGWAIMGDSTGGYCATKIAMRHYDRYSAAVNLSGYFDALQDITTGDLYGGSKTVRQENDLLWRAQNLPQPPINLLVTSCRTGEVTYPQAAKFLSLVRQPLQADSLILDSGGHNFRTFKRMVPPALEWLSSHLHAE
ncbi:MAG: putative esterase [Actinomycetia bacterium]|nr:putative esterase [Actinomycetes bacterium]